MKASIRILSLAGLLLATGLISVTGQEWPQWRGANRDSKVSGFKPPTTWPGELTEQWKIRVGYGDATPVLAKGKLYVFTRIGAEEVLQCLDALTGNQLWNDSYPAEEVTGPAARHPGPRSTPTVINGMVVTIGATGIISCLDALSGELLWRNSEYANTVPVYFTGMSPVIFNNICYAHLGSADNSSIVAFNMDSGDIVWKQRGDGPSYASPGIMTVGGTKMVVMQTDRSLMGLSVNDGTLLWTIPTPVERRYYNSSSPIIEGDKIYYSGQGKGSAAATIAKNGNEYEVTEIWRNSAIGTTYNTPVLKDGFLYGLSERGYLFSINSADGLTAWADTTRHKDFGSVIDAGNLMLALSSSSNLVVFKPETQGYNQVALIKVADTPTYAHPIISGKRIYIKDEEYLILFTVD